MRNTVIPSDIFWGVHSSDFTGDNACLTSHTKMFSNATSDSEIICKGSTGMIYQQWQKYLRHTVSTNLKI